MSHIQHPWTFYNSNPYKNLPSPCILYDNFNIFWDFISVARAKLLQFKVTFMLDQWKQQERTKRQQLRVVNECSMYEKAFRTKPGSADRQRKWKMWRIAEKNKHLQLYSPPVFTTLNHLYTLYTRISLGKRFGVPLVIFPFGNFRNCW